MNILITGSSGYIGKKFYDHATQNNISAIGLSRKPSPDQKHIVVPDFLTHRQWSDVFKDIDTVVHTVGLAHVKRPDQDFYTSNFEITKKLAFECINAGVRRFVFLSSVAVYGQNNYPGKVSLSTRLCPQTAYGKSKLLAEEFLLNLHAKGKLDVVLIRPPMVYGPSCPGNIQLLIKAIQRGIPLPFKGINNQRSFICIENLCSAMLQCALHPTAPGNTFLVSDDHDISIETLIQSLAQGINVPPKLFYCPPSLLKGLAKVLGKEETLMKLIGSYQIDITDIQTKLNWYPETKPFDGLLKSAS